MKTIQGAVNGMLAKTRTTTTSRSKSTDRARAPRIINVGAADLQLPHPIPAGKENEVCPITGLSAADAIKAPDVSESAALALARLEADPDIIDEAASLKLKKPVVRQHMLARQRVAMPAGFIKLKVVDGTHRANGDTRRLVQAIGGLPMLRRFTNRFYELCFADPHIDQFIRSHSDPHGERFACWIAEKFGHGTPWTDERRTRPVDVMQIGRQRHEVAYDRSSAHYAAWHSPKRPAHKWGEHFKLDDARVWMRLHFWAARDCGLFEPEMAAFMDYYVRFIGHFIGIYSSRSPPFTRESARWSADPKNIEKYAASGNCMTNVIDKSLDSALSELPAEERVYTGSRHQNPAWPYNSKPRR
jgi:hypothetical protein